MKQNFKFFTMATNPGFSISFDKLTQGSLVVRSAHSLPVLVVFSIMLIVALIVTHNRQAKVLAPFTQTVQKARDLLTCVSESVPPPSKTSELWRFVCLVCVVYCVNFALYGMFLLGDVLSCLIVFCVVALFCYFCILTYRLWELCAPPDDVDGTEDELLVVGRARFSCFADYQLFVARRLSRVADKATAKRIRRSVARVRSQDVVRDVVAQSGYDGDVELFDRCVGRRALDVRVLEEWERVFLRNHVPLRWLASASAPGPLCLKMKRSRDFVELGVRLTRAFAKDPWLFSELRKFAKRCCWGSKDVLAQSGYFADVLTNHFGLEKQSHRDLLDFLIWASFQGKFDSGFKQLASVRVFCQTPAGSRLAALLQVGADTFGDWIASSFASLSVPVAGKTEVDVAAQSSQEVGVMSLIKGIGGLQSNSLIRTVMGVVASLIGVQVFGIGAFAGSMKTLLNGFVTDPVMGLIPNIMRMIEHIKLAANSGDWRNLFLTSSVASWIDATSRELVESKDYKPFGTVAQVRDDGIWTGDAAFHAKKMDAALEQYRFLSNAKGDPVAVRLRNLVIEQKTFLEGVATKAEAQPQPAWWAFYGPPGNGKSEILDRLVRVFYPIDFPEFDMNDEAGFSRACTSNTYRYSTDPKIGFAQGFHNQCYAILEDIHAVIKDSPFPSQITQLVNIFKAPVTSASLDDKERNVSAYKAVFTTSNRGELTFEQDVVQVARRATYSIEVVATKEFEKTFGKVTENDGVWKMRCMHKDRELTTEDCQLSLKAWLKKGYPLCGHPDRRVNIRVFENIKSIDRNQIHFSSGKLVVEFKSVVEFLEWSRPIYMSFRENGIKRLAFKMQPTCEHGLRKDEHSGKHVCRFTCDLKLTQDEHGFDCAHHKCSRNWFSGDPSFLELFGKEGLPRAEIEEFMKVNYPDDPNAKAWWEFQCGAESVVSDGGDKLDFDSDSYPSETPEWAVPEHGPGSKGFIAFEPEAQSWKRVVAGPKFIWWTVGNLFSDCGFWFECGFVYLWFRFTGFFSDLWRGAEGRVSAENRARMHVVKDVILKRTDKTAQLVRASLLLLLVALGGALMMYLFSEGNSDDKAAVIKKSAPDVSIQMGGVQSDAFQSLRSPAMAELELQRRVVFRREDVPVPPKTWHATYERVVVGSKAGKNVTVDQLKDICAQNTYLVSKVGTSEQVFGVKLDGENFLIPRHLVLGPTGEIAWGTRLCIGPVGGLIGLGINVEVTEKNCRQNAKKDMLVMRVSSLLGKGIMPFLPEKLVDTVEVKRVDGKEGTVCLDTKLKINVSGTVGDVMIRAIPHAYNDMFKVNNIVGKPGDCGMAYVASVRGESVVVGIHVADVGNAVVCRLDKEALKALCFDREVEDPELSPEAQKFFERFPVGELSKTTQITSVPGAPIGVMGSVDLIGITRKSEVVKTPAWSDFQGSLSKEYGAPYLGSGKVTKDGWASPFTRRVKPLLESFTVASEAFDNAVEDYTSGIKISPCRPLADGQAFLGDDESAALKLSTSSGQPWTLLGKSPKTKMIKIVNGDVVVDPALVSAVVETEKILLERPVVILTEWSLKDEVVSSKKFDDAATRVFAVSGVAFNVLGRKYLLPIMNQLYADRDGGEAMCGVNAYSEEWHDFASRASRFGDGVMAGDQEKYDIRHSAEMFRVVAKVVKILAKRCGFTKEEVKICANLVYSCIFQLVLFRGDMFYLATGLASGLFLTTFVNCVINSMLFRLCFELKFPGMSFRENVFLRTYGDDILASVARALGWTQLDVRAGMAKLGYVYTSSKKDGTLAEFDKWSDVAFLKRGFRLHEGLDRYVAPLEKDSIFKMLSWALVAEVSPLARLKEVYRAAVRESFFHEREFFDEMVVRCNESAAKLGVEFVRESYDELCAIYRSGDLFVPTF